MPALRPPVQPTCAAIVLVALLVTALADGPRTALAIAAIAGAVVLTRLRFAVPAATVAVVLFALAVIIGNGPRDDDRPLTKPSHARGQNA